MSDWRAENSIYRNSVDFLVVDERAHDFCVGQPTEIMMIQSDPGTLMQPTLSVHPEEAQQIMNELWRIGIRPKNGAGAIAHTESLQSHLEDLRTIAFHALKIK